MEERIVSFFSAKTSSENSIRAYYRAYVTFRNFSVILGDGEYSQLLLLSQIQSYSIKQL